jgi:hypothetical protein
VALGACATDPNDVTVDVMPVGPEMTGLHVVGNKIQNAAGNTVILRGVNRSGTEYKCVQNGGIFDGPDTLASVAAIATWHANAVRIPLNEDCWLDINGITAGAGGDAYKQAIAAYVDKLHQFHIVPILDLHWVAPGTTRADRQQPMPDADHAAAFWTDLATTFGGDDGVVFDLYNEPYPDANHDTDAAWQCWRDGCTVNQNVPSGTAATTFQATGLQALVDAVRAAGSNNLITLGGVQYSNTFTQFLAYLPLDPAGNLVASWHAYNFNGCKDATCWNAAPAAVVAAVPLVATEIGQNDCGDTFISPLTDWLDGHGSGYLAWSWNAFGACQPQTMSSRGQPWSLVTDLNSGTPNSTYARTFQSRVERTLSP